MKLPSESDNYLNSFIVGKLELQLLVHPYSVSGTVYMEEYARTSKFHVSSRSVAYKNELIIPCFSWCKSSPTALNCGKSYT